jgi:hypothetical protein
VPASSQLVALFFAPGFFYLEDGDTFLRNVGSYKATSQKTSFTIVTAVKAPNHTEFILLDMT